MYTIVLDAVGGDFGVDVTVQASILAVQEYDVQVILTGPKDLINDHIGTITDFPHDRIQVVHAPDIIKTSESPSKAYRKKKQSSIHVGLELVKSKQAHGFVSAGNTGAMLTASTFILGRLEHVERPALAAVMPSTGGPFVMLDLGSNVDCKSNHLVQFAIMGHYFAHLILHVQQPRVGLLNIGEEEDKGNALTNESYPLLKDLPIHFIGNIESNEILNNTVDVVVCDGFIGNNILKFGEGIFKVCYSFFKQEAKGSLRNLLGLFLLKKSLKKFKHKFSYDTKGGAHFLGVNGVSIVAHGSASPFALKNAIKTAIDSVESQVTEKISVAIQENQVEKLLSD